MITKATLAVLLQKKNPYLPSLARYDTSPDLWHVLHRRKLSQIVSKRPVHTGMSLKGQTNWGGKLSNTVHPSALRKKYSVCCRMFQYI